MSDNAKPYHINPAKHWIITIGIFLFIQLIFITVDGTFLEPKLNDSGNLFTRAGRWILDSKLFTEWISPYSFSLFNICMTIHATTILIQAGRDIISSMFSKK